MQPGDKIGLMCKVRYEWTLIDFAAWFAGAVLVPVYETSSPAQVRWNLGDSGAVAVILETADHFARFDEAATQLAGWVREGKLRHREDILEGIEQAPGAIAGLYRGENLGKRLIRVGPG